MPRSKRSSTISTALWRALLLCLILSGCADQVKIHDDEFCGDAGKFGGRCFTVLSDKKRVIAPDVWNGLVGPDRRFGRICGTPAAFGNIKASLLKLCQVSGDCTRDELKMLERFEANVSEAARGY